MPHSKPSNIARWGETAGEVAGSNITEPASGQKDTGWTTNQVPPSSYFNWFMNTVHQWIKYLNDLADEAWTWTGSHTFRKTISAQPTSGNTDGINTIGAGTGRGLWAVGGPSGGYALQATTGNAAKAPLHIDVMSADPTSPAEGDVWFNSTSHTFKVYLNGAVKTVTVT